MEQTTVRTQPIKVAIIEDERDIREGLGMLIGYTEGFECVGKYGSMEEALPSIRHRTPDVVLSDIGLPGMDGIEGVKILKERFPAVTILMLSVYDDNERIFDALCAGAVGYLLKKTPPARLIDSLNDAIGGGSPMSPEIARKVVALFPRFPPARTSRIRFITARTSHFKAACRRSQLQNGSGEIERDDQHDFVSLEKHLRKAASSFKIGSRR
jgi:DNA-binding NarL/FixJ family response regulator